MSGPTLGAARTQRSPATETSTAADAVIGRVRRVLDALGDFAHLHVRTAGNHIVLESRNAEKDRAPARAPVARLTALGREAYGLSFYDSSGGWEPIVLVDLLEEIVVAMMGGIDLTFELPPALLRSSAA